MSKKKVLYFQNYQNASRQTVVDYEPIIQPDDIIHIEIISTDPEVVAVFNKNSSLSTPNANNNPALQGYLVDKSGAIEFPVLGAIKVAGYTKTGLIDSLKQQLKMYVKDPIVSIRILNFKVTILGEVNSPGTYTFNSEKVSFSELIGRAGDISMQGKRDNVIIVRDNDGVKTFHSIDFTQASIVNSPHYYLHQNDVVYIEPRRSKIDSGAIPPLLTNSVSILSILLTTYLLIRGIK